MKKTKSTPRATPRRCAVSTGSGSAAVRHALAACRAIVFAEKQASRHRGEYSLNDILAAHSLAATALSAAEQEGLQ